MAGSLIAVRCFGCRHQDQSSSSSISVILFVGTWLKSHSVMAPMSNFLMPQTSTTSSVARDIPTTEGSPEHRRFDSESLDRLAGTSSYICRVYGAAPELRYGYSIARLWNRSRPSPEGPRRSKKSPRTSPTRLAQASP